MSGSSYVPWKTFLCVLVTLLPVAAAIPTTAQTPAPAPALYKSGEGPLTVSVADDLTLHDPQSGRDIPVKVYYPQGKGPFPVILFSHGAGGSKDNYGLLARYWSSYGYVCLLPTHADSLIQQRQQGTAEGTGIRGALRDVNDPAAWQARARDIMFLIDSLPRLEAMATELRGKLDRTRVGVGGHSFGAYTTMLVGGATVTLPGTAAAKSYSDPRPRAFLALSSQGPGGQGLTIHSWDTFTRPLMTMTGSNDLNVFGRSADWREQPFRLSPGRDKYHVFLEGANHFTFTGGFVERTQNRPPPNAPGQERARLLGNRFGGHVPDPTVLFGYIESASLAFWDAYLKNDQRAFHYLHSDQLQAASKGIARLSRR